MKSLHLLILFSLLVTGCAKETPSPEPQISPDSPDEVVRAFFIAMLSCNEVEIRKHILPNPDASWLWYGQAPPPDVLTDMETQFNNMTLREHKVGETIILPGGHHLEISDQMVNEYSKLVTPTIGGKPMPTPLPLVKLDGHWKVDAGSLIAARKAANKTINNN